MPQNIAHILEEKPRTKDILIDENVNFDSLLLSNTTLQGLNDSGFYRPSPIQLKAIPLARCGLDLIVQAKSGTGKTAVFAITALEIIDTERNAVQVLVVAPTREIAVQVDGVIKALARHQLNLKVAAFIGGLPLAEDIKNLKTCQVAVGAPGRIKHLIEKSHLKTSNIRLLVLDEADKLMEESLQNDINYIFHQLPERKQVLALSATYPDQLDKFLTNYMRSPTFVSAEIEMPVLVGLRQFVSVVKSHKNVTRQINIKTAELVRIFSKVIFTQCLVFFNSQMRAEGVSTTLNKDKWNTLYISAAQTQQKRLQAIDSLRNFQCKILLSTDLTARGIDVANIDLVVNYDVPYDMATYLHRIGRAGRYGSPGICVTIAEEDELEKFQTILGEIGGDKFSIASFPPEDGFRDVWKTDINEFDQIYGTNPRNLRLKQNGNDITKSMSSDLQKLSVEEVSNKPTKSNQDTHKNNIVEDVKSILNHKNKFKQGISQKVSEMNSGELLKSLANGSSLTISKNNEKCSSAKEIIKTVLNDNTETDTTVQIEDPSALYPWVPVEAASSVFSASVGENLLETSSNDALDITNKRKRKQCKLPVTETKNPVLLRNLATYSVAKLLKDDTIADEDIKCIEDHLALFRGNKKSSLKRFELCTSEDLLNNLDKHAATLQEPPKSNREDIFRLGFNYMIKDATHWIEALGDSYEPVPESVKDEESEGEYSDCSGREEYMEEEIEEEFDQDYNLPKLNELQSQNNIESYVDNSSYNSTYDGYFDTYREMLENNGQTFEDIPSFSNYFTQWQYQVQSVRDFVQQNIYLQEMNQYQYYNQFNSDG